MYPSRPAPAPPVRGGSAPPYEPFPTLPPRATSANSDDLYSASEWNESTSTLTSFTIPREPQWDSYMRDPPAYVPIATSSPSSPASQCSDRTQNTGSTAWTSVPSPFPFSDQASSPCTQRKPRSEPLLNQPLTATSHHAAYHLGHPTARSTPLKSQTLPLSAPRPGHSESSTTTFMQVPSDYAFLQHRSKQTLLADLETIAGKKIRFPVLDMMLGTRKEESKEAGRKLRKEKRQSWEDEWIDGHEKVLAWQASSPRKNNWI